MIVKALIDIKNDSGDGPAVLAKAGTRMTVVKIDPEFWICEHGAWQFPVYHTEATKVLS